MIGCLLACLFVGFCCCCGGGGGTSLCRSTSFLQSIFKNQFPAVHIQTPVSCSPYSKTSFLQSIFKYQFPAVHIQNQFPAVHIQKPVS